jgi:beta-glucanase (GH16 family)
MKTIFLIILSICTIFGAHAQSNEGFQYQSIIRNPAGDAAGNRPVNVQFDILQAHAEGAVVYSETQETATDAAGRIQLTIGAGNVLAGQFNAIEWDRNDYYVKTSIDQGDGSTHSSTQQLISVPYALSAATAGSVEKKSPDGTVWKLHVDDEGVLSAQEKTDNIIPIPNGYSRLAFHDEFDGEGLPDASKWSYEEGYIRNGEMQYYTVAREENCYQKDGYLHIVCRNDSLPVENAKIQHWPEIRKDSIVPVTSASIHTKDKASWTYCRVEVRAKLPLCLGTWPAIWMMPEGDVYGYWPNSGEIDIMEHVGYDPNRIHYTLHCRKYNWNAGTNPRTLSVNCYNVNTEFHIYALEWNEDRIEFYLDGALKYRVNKNNGTWEEWPFHLPFYLILNTGFGGGWGGREGVDLSGLPQDYVIDYVRIYQ